MTKVVGLKLAAVEGPEEPEETQHFLSMEHRNSGHSYAVAVLVPYHLERQTR